MRLTWLLCGILTLGALILSGCSNGGNCASPNGTLRGNLTYKLVAYIDGDPVDSYFQRVENATITVVDPSSLLPIAGTSLAKSDKNGNFILRNIPPGTYTVKVDYFSAVNAPDRVPQDDLEGYPTLSAPTRNKGYNVTLKFGSIPHVPYVILNGVDVSSGVNFTYTDPVDNIDPVTGINHTTYPHRRIDFSALVTNVVLTANTTSEMNARIIENPVTGYRSTLKLYN